MFIIKKSNKFYLINIMDIVESIDIVKGLIHTFIRFLPLGLYFFTYFSSTLYKDKRSIILLIGLIFNDIIGAIYKKYSGIVPNDTCAVFGNNEGTTLNFLPNSHTEIMAFIMSFFYSEIWLKGNMTGQWFKLNFLLFMMIITVWSRINIGCETSYQRIIFDILFGMVRGSIFYYLFSSQYKDTSTTNLEKTACDANVSGYTCENIKNGNVIIKDPLHKDNNDNNDNDHNDD
jgi:hypothetical protein